MCKYISDSSVRKSVINVYFLTRYEREEDVCFALKSSPISMEYRESRERFSNRFVSG